VRYLAALLFLATWTTAQAQIVPAPTTVPFGSFVQGQTIPSQTVNLTSTTAWKATPGANWVTATPSTGQTTSTGVTVTLAIVAANLPVQTAAQGTTVVFSSTATTGSPPAPVTVNITITHLPVLSLSATSFNYNALPGQTPPVSSFAITANNPANAAWTITPAVTTPKLGTWLEVSTRTGSGSLDTVIVLINTAGLAVGAYSGTITVTPGTPGTPAVLPVTLVINSGVPNVSLSSPYFSGGSNLAFAGSAPATQNFTLINTGGNIFSWTATVATISGGNWLLASPKSGTSASTITVAVNGVGLAAGTYNGTITLSIPGAVVPSLVVNVSYTINSTTPIISANGVVSSATFLNGPLSPGQLFTIFGTNLANGVAAAVPVGSMLPTTVGVTSVTLGGLACPLIYVSPRQINAQAPFELVGTTAQVIVTLSGVAGQAVVVNAAATTPAIFSVDGTGQGVGTIVRATDFTLITTSNPARKGEAVAIYCTGLGQVTGGGVTGLLPSAAAAATATVGVRFGTANATVTYAGLAVGFAGLYQINATVPPSAAPGTGGVITITINIGAVTSPSINTYVK